MTGRSASKTSILDFDSGGLPEEEEADEDGEDNVAASPEDSSTSLSATAGSLETADSLWRVA